jgi:hypothetical protein
MILSILICRIPSREQMFNNLSKELNKQIASGNYKVEILWSLEGWPTGQKRNDLVNKAQGEYVCHFDDDDWPSEDYVSSIMKALESKPDAVGFKGWITTNGKNKKEFSISKDLQYKDTVNGYERFNNHLSPIKKEIAVQFKFPHCIWQEDYRFAKAVHDAKAIQTEVFIDKHLYNYRYVTKKTYT